MYPAKFFQFALGSSMVWAVVCFTASFTNATTTQATTTQATTTQATTTYPANPLNLSLSDNLSILERSPDPTPLLLAQQNDFASFMESGTLQSESRFRITAPSDPTIRINRDNPGWQFFAFRNGNVSLWIPPGRLTQETLVLQTAAGAISTQALIADNKDGRYIAAYASDLSPAQSNASILYDAIKQRVSSRNNMVLQSEKPVTVNNFSGQEVRFTNADQIVVLRMYLVGNRFYVMGVQALSANFNSQAATGFLNSLQQLSG